MHAQVLKVDVGGLPIAWLTWEEAVTDMAQEKPLWSMGTVIATIRGGYNLSGERTVIELPSIIATRDQSNIWTRDEPRRANRQVVVQRDRNTCMYCGTKVYGKNATLDHVHPKSRGGSDAYTNILLACSPCNRKKSNRTPSEAGMPMLGVPYAPNPAARLILSGRRVLADQMDYLQVYANVPKERQH